MADPIVIAVFNSTIGWLLNEGRDRVAKKFKEGDVVDQWLCNLIARELDDIKSKLNGLAQKDLGASISFYNEGLKMFSHEAKTEVDGVSAKGEQLDAIAKSLSADAEAFSCASKITISPNVKERFKDARRRATDAFNDTALSPSDRIFAMYIRVKATLLEEVDDPICALELCKYYLEEMYSMREVKENFNLDIKRRFIPKRLLKEDKRGKLICSVCHVSRIVFDVVQLVGGDSVLQEFFVWPTICNDKRDEIDPLRDPRLKETLEKQGMEHFSVIRSFGQEGEKDNHRLKLPRSIATNSQGQFLVVDNTATKVYDSSGKFLYTPRVATDKKFQYDTMDIDTDRKDNLYLLVWVANKQEREDCWYEVHVFDNIGKPCPKFQLRKNSKGRKLAVNSTRDDGTDEVLVLEGDEKLNAQVEVYETSGKFVCEFGGRILQHAKDIVGANAGRTLVLDCPHEAEKMYVREMFVREFSAERELLRSIPVMPNSVAIAFHRGSGHIVIEFAPFDLKKGGYRERLSIYKAPDANNNDDEGKLVRVIELDALGISLDQALR